MAGSSLSSSDGIRQPSPLMQLLSNSKRESPGKSLEGVRMLLSISWMGSIWEVRVVVSGQETVKGVIKAALAAFAKEGRTLPSGPNPNDYHLFSSRFALQSLDIDARLMDLGARSFVLRGKF
eukprot:c22697_g1_i1 orf=901-1266(+)